MSILKIFGLLIVFLVPTVLGFLKSFSVNQRSEKLKRAVMALNELSSFVRTENISKENLFSKCFKKELLSRDFTVNPDFLKQEDIILINEFLNGFGSKDKLSEYERINLYSKRIEEQFKLANEESNKLCKLYSSLGVLSGLAICIFLF